MKDDDDDKGDHRKCRIIRRPGRKEKRAEIVTCHTTGIPYVGFQ